MELHRLQHPVRMVTAAALFDGHDAAINIMRRLLIGMGAEVIHLGHNRSVEEIVTEFPSLHQDDVKAAIVFAAASAEDDMPLSATPPIR